MKRNTCILAWSLIAGFSAAAELPKVEDFKVKLTGVAVMPTDDDEDDERKAKVLPPQTRIVVTPGNLAVFYLEYNFPTNVQSRMYLGPNFDEGVLGEDPFGTSASGLVSGKGKITKVVLLGAGGNEPYEKDFVLVFIDTPSDKSVLTERAKKENPKLVKKYGIKGFPMTLILNGDGKKVGETGYRKGGAKPYAEHLLDIKKKR